MSKIKGVPKSRMVGSSITFFWNRSLILPTADIGYVVSPFFFLIASASLWIWRKGRHGTAKETTVGLRIILTRKGEHHGIQPHHLTTADTKP